MTYRPQRISEVDFRRSDPSGVCSEEQLEAILLGAFARALRMRDRRPQGVTIAVNHATGLPESSASLLPKLGMTPEKIQAALGKAQGIMSDPQKMAQFKQSQGG